MSFTATKLGLQAIVLGGSGQVGSKLLSALQKLPECSKVTVLSRRPLDDFSDDKIKVEVIDYDSLGESKMDAIFKSHNAAFMMMGVGASSKSNKDELERIDADIPIAFAQACARNDVQHMSVLSAVGADPTAKYSNITKTAAGGGWYSYCKGKMEEGIKALPFESVVIVRPAAIYPGNNNTPSALGWINAKLNPILPGRFETASSQDIAESMVTLMKQQVAKVLQGTKVIDGGKAVKDSVNGGES